MKCLIGLGNPGAEYEGTRHNFGFMVVDRVAKLRRMEFKPGKGKYWESKDKSGSLLLMKPTTFMNESGLAVKELKERYGFPASNMMVIYDDLDLPFGSVRIRERGSAGGHHGMESIIYHLNSEDFPRIRLGIDDDNRSDDVDFVLSRFEEVQLDEVEKTLSYAAEGALEFIYNGINTSMNKYNKRENKNMMNKEDI
ncbi:MAG: aminoacyl-tRNA hydrolase [Candidatus Marinimicrobia bacterium]|nr:aminoacyl-tRNA hydrolase [Candidatus Neomarinimicrobiota bacterium]